MKMKLKYCFILLLLVCFLCGNVYAEDLNENLTSDSTLIDDNQAILDENLESEDISDDVTTGTDEVLGDVENENFEDEAIIYFDANAQEDGNGSKEKPYNYLSDDRVPMMGGTIYLAKGSYEFKLSDMTMENGFAQVGYLNIVGEDRENTFLYSGAIISFVGDNTISNITLNGLLLNVYDVPEYRIVSSLTMDNVIVNSLNMMDGTYRIFNSKLTDGVAQPIMEENTYGGAINALSPINLELENCSFINNKADFGGAINMLGGSLIVDNCSFIANTANNYGGAIAAENNTYLQITNSRFENNNALADAGGALYIRDSEVTLENVNITESAASFGGAVTALNSTLNIKKSNFKKNNAAFYGGAVYAMYCEVTLEDNSFENNTALFGGAFFVDNSMGSVKSDFINNSALVGSAVYSFSNEVSFDDVFVDDELYVSDRLNLTIYDSGEYPVFRYNPSNLTVLPNAYNLVDYGWVSGVKNQLTEGNCWAFTAMAVLESCILKASNGEYDFSEENMKNIMAYYSDYGWSYFMTNTGGGNMDLANGYFTSWFGPILDSEDPYTNKGVLSPLLKSIFHVQNVVFLKRDDYLDNDMIKRALLDYGAVGTSMYFDDMYLSNLTNAFYCGDDLGIGNHAITIVGWNDTYSKDNFLTSPEGDGAWIVKNSWGNDWGDNGYFYVSYYDKMFAPVGQSESAYTIILNDTIKYDKNYQYETSKVTYWDIYEGDELTYYNIFTIEGDEYLAAVSTYFNKTYNYKIEISVNGEPKAIKESSTNPGYYTIPLDSWISLKKGDKLKVSFTIKSVDETQAAIPVYFAEYFTNNILTKGISFVANDGDDYDLFDDNACACIKAFTIVDEIKTDISLTLDDNQIIAVVMDEYGNIMDGSVRFTINTYNETVEIKNGTAILDYDFKYYDIYNISVSWNKTGYEKSSNNTLYDAPFDVSLKVNDIEYNEDLIVNITLNGAKLLKNNITITIGDYRYSVNQSDLIFKVPDTLDAKLWNVSLSYATENGYEKIINQSFTINKAKSGFTGLKPFNFDYGNDFEIWIRYMATYNPQMDWIEVPSGAFSGKTNFLSINCWGAENVTVTVIGDAKPVITNENNVVKLSNLSAGEYKLNITTIPNENHVAISQLVDFTVNKVDSTLDLSDIEFDYGDVGYTRVDFTGANNITASVNDENAVVKIKQYPITINLNGEDLLSNSIIMSADRYVYVSLPLAIYVSNLTAGNYILSVTTVPDENHNAVTKNVTVTVNRINDTVNVTIPEITAGKSNVIPIKLTSGATGNITLTIDNVAVQVVSLVNGSADVEIPKLSPGNHEILISYSGDKNHANFTQTQTVFVESLAKITAGDVNSYYDDGSSYRVRVFGDDGTPLNGAKVIIKLNGKQVAVKTTDKNGYAIYKIVQKPKSYTITAEVNGLKTSNKLKVKQIIKTKKISKVKKSRTTKIKITLKGKKVYKKKTLTIKFKGKKYKVKTNSKGVAKFKVTKKMLKKFKKGKKVKYTISYKSDKLTRYVKVVK